MSTLYRFVFDSNHPLRGTRRAPHPISTLEAAYVKVWEPFESNRINEIDTRLPYSSQDSKSLEGGLERKGLSKTTSSGQLRVHGGAGSRVDGRSDNTHQ